MEFVRSIETSREGCTTGPKENPNQVTPVIDGSTIYGDNETLALSLRTRRGGQLVVDNRFKQGGQNDLLPTDNTIDEENCQTPPCFLAGDFRVNQQPALASMHTVWMREHNRLCKELARLNPSWNDETLYQEARRIVIAEIQHITYNEYLPIILGPEFMRVFQLELTKSGFFTGYDTNTKPVLSNEFAAAPYRFGHSLIQGNFQSLTGEHQRSPFDAVLGDNYFDMRIPRDTLFGNDQLLLGMCAQKARSVDTDLTVEVTNRLYRTRARPNVGLDLFAINVHRGRDNGVPPYNDWRVWCGFPRVNRFDDLRGQVDPGIINKLQSLYGSVEDLDLYPLGLAEQPRFGAIMGPTFACMIAQQFRQLKKGDRFWYENGGQAGSFKPEQLNQIRKVSLARILCDNLDVVETIQPSVLKVPEFTNRRVACNQIPSVSLSSWAESGGKPGGKTGGSEEIIFPDGSDGFPGKQQPQVLPQPGYPGQRPGRYGPPSGGTYQRPPRY